MYNGSDHHIQNSALARQQAIIVNKSAKLDRIQLYNINPTICSYCNNPLEYAKRNNKFCNNSCSASSTNTNRNHSVDSNIKRSISIRKIKNVNHTIKCKYEHCDILFCNYNRMRYCSDTCKILQRKIAYNNPELLLQKSIVGKKMYAEGKLKGWAKRSNLKPSYPEQYFINMFNKDKIYINREVKKGRFFCDFVWEDRMLVLEVDGSQHTRPDHQERDARKDAFLKSLGYTVFRIQWFNPISDLNKNKLYPQIERFMDTYTNLQFPSII
jgi:very-short-patch-repair endonuclease